MCGVPLSGSHTCLLLPVVCWRSCWAARPAYEAVAALVGCFSAAAAAAAAVAAAMLQQGLAWRLKLEDGPRPGLLRPGVKEGVLVTAAEVAGKCDTAVVG